MVKGPIAKDGVPFIGISLALAVLLGVFFGEWAAVVPAILTLFFSYFFRNPKRAIPQDESLIVSPADGTVMEVSDVEENDFVKGPCQKITIFMSVFDVHINRSPIAGKIKFQEYTCGRFKPAYKDDVGYENERHTIGIEGDRLRIVVTQIAGLLARRIVSWVTVDDKLEKGVRYGMIKFASCVEVTMSKDIELCVKKGDKLKGGVSIIGRRTVK
jgi:phosphatidylserine decarboxylase